MIYIVFFIFFLFYCPSLQFSPVNGGEDEVVLFHVAWQDSSVVAGVLVVQVVPLASRLRKHSVSVSLPSPSQYILYFLQFPASNFLLPSKPQNTRTTEGSFLVILPSRLTMNVGDV